MNQKSSGFSPDPGTTKMVATKTTFIITILRLLLKCGETVTKGVVHGLRNGSSIMQDVMAVVIGSWIGSWMGDVQ